MREASGTPLSAMPMEWYFDFPRFTNVWNNGKDLPEAQASIMNSPGPLLAGRSRSDLAQVANKFAALCTHLLPLGLVW